MSALGKDHFQRRGARRRPLSARHVFHSAGRRGMILVVVLAVIALLAVLGASFSFRMNADMAGVSAVRNQQQARLAAESGIDRVILLLRDERTDMDMWYDNREAFHRVPIRLPNKVGGSESLADKEEIKGEPVWRYTIIAYERDGQQEQDSKLRFGLTDEAGKINLNTAPRMQLIKLFEQIAPENVQPAALADALIDWRDKNDEPNSEFGAESNYYMTLNPHYRAKNKWLESVDELLMIKGFNGRILYGEDYNRNGWLDPNEDDGGNEGQGQVSMFPPDDGDGKLNRGMLPLVTVYSWDWNRSNDNKLRLNINTVNFKSLDKLPKSLTEKLTEELPETVINFIAEAQGRGYKFRSVGELSGLEVYEDGSSNYDEVWAAYDKEITEIENAGKQEIQPAEDGSGQDKGQDQNDQGKTGGAEPEGRRRSGAEAEENQDSEVLDAQSGGGKNSRRQKDIDSGALAQAEPDKNDDRDGDRGGERRGGRRGARPAGSGAERSGNRPEAGGGRRGGGGRDAAEGRSIQPVEGQAGGGKSKKAKGTPIISPVDNQTLAVCLDRLSVTDVGMLPGLININTAPKEVLTTIPSLTPEEVDNIISVRKRLDGAQKATPAWLATSGVFSDPCKFAVICNGRRVGKGGQLTEQITTRSIQFTIDAIGFADHVGTVKRIQAVVEMQGHVAQFKYYRDITSLGIGYPLKEEDERKRGYASGSK